MWVFFPPSPCGLVLNVLFQNLEGSIWFQLYRVRTLLNASNTSQLKQ